MAYAIHKHGAEALPVDGEPVGWRAIPEGTEPEAYEIVVEELPPGQVLRWNAAEGVPRLPTADEREEQAREETLQRLAVRAEEAAAATFINPNDVIGLLGGVVYKDRNGIALSEQEEQGLEAVHALYQHGLAKKDEVAQTLPEQLDELEW